MEHVMVIFSMCFLAHTTGGWCLLSSDKKTNLI